MGLERRGARRCEKQVAWWAVGVDSGRRWGHMADTDDAARVVREGDLSRI